eukprot:1012810-Amphidinium_carterae.2
MGAIALSSAQTCGIGRLAGPAENWSRDSISLPHGSSVQFACRNGAHSPRQPGIVWAHYLKPHSRTPRRRRGPQSLPYHWHAGVGVQKVDWNFNPRAGFRQPGWPAAEREQRLESFSGNRPDCAG